MRADDVPLSEKYRDPQTFCLDFDGTFTADVELWSQWVKLAQSRGHRVVCVTGRRESFEARRELERSLPSGVDVFFAYDEPKRQHAERNGISVDVWIDDIPWMITGD
jgi:hypothetical protein